MAVLLCLLASPRLQAEEDGPQTPEEVRAFVARCIADLRAPEFDVREGARRGLKAYGERARDLLEAVRDDPDPEVRRTIRLVLESAGEAIVQPERDATDLEGHGRVSLEGRGRVKDLLDRLGAAHGARFRLPDETEAADRELDVAQSDAPFFTVLDRVLAPAGLVGQQGFDASGTMVLEEQAGEAEAPWAAAGPLRVRVVEVTSVRTLNVPSQRRYALALDLQWVPSVQVVTYRLPVSVDAKDSQGREFRAGSSMRSNTTYGLGTNARSARLVLHLEPEGEEAASERLATLSFVLVLRLRHDRREVVFDRLTELSPPVRGGEDDEITLQRLEPPSTERSAWVLDVVARLEGQVAQNSLSVLLDRADGTVRQAAAGSRFPSADGTLAISAHGYGQWPEPPVAARVVWFRQEAEGELTFTLKDVPLR